MEQNLRQMYLDIVRKTILGLTYRDPSFDSSKGQQIAFNQTAREPVPEALAPTFSMPNRGGSISSVF